MFSPDLVLHDSFSLWTVVNAYKETHVTQCGVCGLRTLGPGKFIQTYSSTEKTNPCFYQAINAIHSSQRSDLYRSFHCP